MQMEHVPLDTCHGRRTSERPQSGRVSHRGSPILLVVDVQKIFLEQTDWWIPSLAGCLIKIRDLAVAFGERAIFSRYLLDPGGSGTWQTFYRQWQHLDANNLNWELVDGLREPGSLEILKGTYSCFGSRTFCEAMDHLRPSRLVICGVETDCCVLATVLDAVDRGIHVTVVEDAVASPHHTAHAGAIALFQRLSVQVRCSSTSEVLATLGVSPR
jgi:nicotinamidase-related amidase